MVKQTQKIFIIFDEILTSYTEYTTQISEIKILQKFSLLTWDNDSLWMPFMVYYVADYTYSI